MGYKRPPKVRPKSRPKIRPRPPRPNQVGARPPRPPRPRPPRPNQVGARPRPRLRPRPRPRPRPTRPNQVGARPRPRPKGYNPLTTTSRPTPRPKVTKHPRGGIMPYHPPTQRAAPAPITYEPKHPRQWDMSVVQAYIPKDRRGPIRKVRPKIEPWKAPEAKREMPKDTRGIFDNLPTGDLVTPHDKFGFQDTKARSALANAGYNLDTIEGPASLTGAKAGVVYALENVYNQFSEAQQRIASKGEGNFRWESDSSNLPGNTLAGILEGVFSWSRENMTPEQKRRSQFYGDNNKPIDFGRGPVGWIDNAVYNIKQVPIAGKVNEAINSAFMLGTGLPAELAEPLVTNNLFVTKNLKDELGVNLDDPRSAEAWLTALRVGYSGDKAVSDLYKEALKLYDNHLLTAENKKILVDKYAHPMKEMLGQAIFDPLGLFDAVGSGSKALRHLSWDKGARQMFEVAKVTKGTNEMVSTAEILDDLATMTTLGGRVRHGEGVVGKVREALNPLGGRLQQAVVNRTSERITQLPTTIFGQTQTRVASKLAREVADPAIIKSAEFEQRVIAETAKEFQDVAMIWAKTASDDVGEVNRAGEMLAKMGYGDVPKSEVGRYTGIVLDRLMKKPDGEYGDLLSILKVAKKEGLGPEHVAEKFFEKADTVLGELIPQSKWESYLINKGIRKIPVLGLDSNVRKAALAFYGTMYMGASPGFAARNLYDNLAKMIVTGTTPFNTKLMIREMSLNPSKKILKRTGSYIVGSERGISQAGQDAISFMPGTWLAQKGEKFSGGITSSRATVDSLMQNWPVAIKDLDIPKGYEGIIRDAILYDIDKIDEMVKQPGKLTQKWRFVSDDLSNAMYATDQHLPKAVGDILTEAKNPEEAITSLRKLQQEALDFTVTHSGDIKPMGAAQGTLAGHAVDLTRQAERNFNIEKLGQQLAEREHSLLLSRNKAIAGVLGSMDPERWADTLAVAENVFAHETQKIARRQALGYGRILTGELTEEQYAKHLRDLYSRAIEKLDATYTDLIGKGSIAVNPQNPKNTRSLLEAAVMRAAWKKQYPSGVMKGVVEESAEAIMWSGGEVINDAHFQNKIRKILVEELNFPPAEARNIKHLNDVPDQYLSGLFNYFNDGPEMKVQEIANWAAERVNPTAIEKYPSMVSYRLETIPPDTSPGELARQLAIQWDKLDDKLDNLKVVIEQAQASGVNASDLQRQYDGLKRFADKLDDTRDSLIAADSFSKAVVPQVNKELLEFQLDEARQALKNAAEDVDTSGLESRVKKLEDLIEQAEVRVEIGELETIGNATGDPRIQQVVMGAKGQIDNSISPSPLDSIYSSSSENVKAIDNIIDHIKLNAEETQEVGVLSEDLAKELRSRYFTTQILAAEEGRRARDFAYLDYGDKRFMDPIIQTLFPWHYWFSRSMPNWATALTMKPQWMARYYHLKNAIKQSNAKDETIPDWYKDRIPVRIPGYPGTIFWDYNSMFNATAQLAEDFDDPDKERDTFGRILQKMSKGPAVNPMLMAAYAAERGLIYGDTVGMQSYGQISGVTKAVTAATGVTVEPWLWLRDPTTGKLLPFTGGSKWDQQKAGRKLAYNIGEGKVGIEEGMIGEATRYGTAYQQALKEVQYDDPNMKATIAGLDVSSIVGGYRTWPVIASSILGFRLGVQADWELELLKQQSEHRALQDAGQEEQANVMLDNHPGLSASWLANKNENERMMMLANNVILGRIEPMSKVQRDALFEKAGLPSEMMDMYYDKVPLDEWDPRDRNDFIDKILELAEIIGTPSPELAKEWRRARREKEEINDYITEKYPQGKVKESNYFQIKETEGEEAASEYLRANRDLSAMWRDQNKMLLDRPDVLKYYNDPLKVDTIATSMAFDSVRTKYGEDIFDLRKQQADIPDDDYLAKKEMRRLHPEIQESYDYQREMLIQYTKGLDGLRGYTQEDRGAPETISYIIDDKPSVYQKQLLEFIDEMEISAGAEFERKPIPPPKFSPASLEAFRIKNKIYSDAVSKYPELPTLEAEGARIKETYGEDAAKLFYKQNNLYTIWGEQALEKVQSPILLRQMTDKSVSFAAKAIMRKESEKVFPGFMDRVEKEYYTIPYEAKGDRRKWRDDNPNYFAWKEWKKSYEKDTFNRLMGERDRLREMDPEKMVEAMDKETFSDPNIETIKGVLSTFESGGDYSAESTVSTASGKYQYIDGTWAGYGGYDRAMDAPPNVQEERMSKDIADRLLQYGGDLEKVFAAHYYPAWADDPSKWDQKPTPDQITVREYVDQKMEEYNRRVNN